MTYQWTDVQDIAIALTETYPDLDPTYINFVDLRDKVMKLPDFKDAPERCGEKILEAISAGPDRSTLAVIKEFGPVNEKAMLSFPIHGYTLSLDFKRSPTLFPLLQRLDDLVFLYGGRIYLAKDARMNKKMMSNYTKLEQFKAVIRKVNSGGKFTSAQSERIGYLK